MDVKNAIITSAELMIERGLLSSYIFLDYDAGCQGFGGYPLYLPENFTHSDSNHNYAGHWIYKILEIADVNHWSKLAGKTIRVKADHDKVHEIGHIIKNIWFNPKEEFAKMQENNDGK
jgi:hypothetical protein